MLNFIERQALGLDSRPLEASFKDHLLEWQVHSDGMSLESFMGMTKEEIELCEFAPRELGDLVLKKTQSFPPFIRWQFSRRSLRRLRSEESHRPLSYFDKTAYKALLSDLAYEGAISEDEKSQRLRKLR